MRNKITKIALILLPALLLYSCSLTKRVPEDKHLLKKNTVTVNGEEKKDEEVHNQLYQQPNSEVLGYHIRLHLYNLSKKNADSSYQAWLDRNPKRHESLRKLLSEKQVRRLGNSFVVAGLSNFFKKVGEPPVLVDPARVRKSANRLLSYYYRQGYFRTKVGFRVDTLGSKKAEINYNVVTGDPYIVDTVSTYIESPALDTLYQNIKPGSLVKSGKQYNESDFTGERERITNYFLNRGVYRFEPNYISYIVDTVSTGHKANVDLIIDNELVREGDSTYTRPFKIWKVNRVNIYTQNAADPEGAIDSTSYNGFNIYSSGKLNYRPKALTDPVFIAPGSTFSDFRRVLTYRYINNLRVFYYPNINYVVDSTDVNGNSLIANIYLRPRDKFKLLYGIDLTHSNIQDMGILGTTGLSIYNVFRGAEILNLTLRGNIGSSRDPSINDRTFFNILEYGADAKLTFPRIFFPLNTDKIIPKEMLPSSLLSLGISRQKNIGLDKESFTGILNYSWTPRRNRSAKLDLFNIQYIRNVNAKNYFNVYNSSYDRLNAIAADYLDQLDPSLYTTNEETGDNYLIIEEGTSAFIRGVQNNSITVTAQDNQDVRSIEERRKRLAENNLISATNFTYTTNSQDNLTDNAFFIFKTKIETAGNTLGLISSITEKDNRSRSGNRTFLDVEYSQYVKGELDFIKHFDLRRNKVLAMRAFFGLAVPYGNSNTIPFTRSYFAGGSNDNRAWQSYSLGPGRSGSVNDFNEANLKMSYSAELRFNIFGQLNGAVFGDVGNIWNIFDSQDDPDYTFNGLSSFRDLALGSGFGFRYDFSFFVVRFDIGFKTYNPGRPENDRWFKEYNFSHAVYNIGINYPF